MSESAKMLPDLVNPSQCQFRISTNLVTEQVLMRSLKTSGELSRGQSMTNTQRLVWVLSSPVSVEVSNALQELTGVSYTTSDQHKDLTHSH